MGSIKSYLANFGLSVLGYAIVAVWSYLVLVVLVVMGETFVGQLTLGSRIVFLLLAGINFVLLFFLGTRLNLLGNAFLNYTSVVGVSLILLLISLTLPNLRIFVTAPFAMPLSLVVRILNEPAFWVEMLVYSLFPSIVIWSGMLFKSRKQCN